MTSNATPHGDGDHDPRPGMHRAESWATTPAIRRTMQGCRGRDTSSELALRSAVHRLGLRYSVDMRPVDGVRRKADLVFRRERFAVFMDGCFWHGCPHHYSAPVSHAEFWETKLTTNRLRDSETDRLLSESGWAVLRVWEHEDAGLAARRVSDALVELRARRDGLNRRG
ncbi:MAG TPA: very short patch repair endonuclease [Chloroflexota bacterium]|nr:very short patch repair endonuclease [Chloroflexota bacterium]